jgi:putative acetyltransferase
MSNILVDIVIRPICESDNEILAALIREVLIEHGADKPGTAFSDKNLDQLNQTFSYPGSAYFVAEQNDTIIGSGGIYPSPGLPKGYCELVKLYVARSARNTGVGSKLIAACFSAAKANGYTHLYLETMPELGKAIKLYERIGFRYLKHALGNSEHFNCTIWMLSVIKPIAR